jgi:hypothetical protein
MAKSTALNVPQQTFPAGEFTSPTFTIPNGVNQVRITFTIAAADAGDATKSLSFTCERRDPNNANNWIFDHGFTWQGNADAKSPSMEVDVGPLAGQTCRFRAALSQALSASASVTTS